ncbi:MAG: hypothetical protein BMS9Abin02_0578 [Anaerolineae bacterium]|nr:MAG: hypothetical protein BMS9Abin02_0578 [Anaerolineae bacterium]
MSMIFCPQCGTENVDTNRECRACAFDFMTGSNLVCPICQFENNALIDQCKQCGTDLTAVSAVSDPDGKDSATDLARIAGPLPAPPTRRFTPEGITESSGETDEPGDFDDWLDEVISGKSDDEFRGDSALFGDEGPVWAVGSGLALSDTMELEEESLPDWLKNLKETDDVKEEEPATPTKRKLASWLDESKLTQLEKKRDLEKEIAGGEPSDQKNDSHKKIDQISGDEKQVKDTLQAATTAPFSEQDQEADIDSQQSDEWLVELAAMGSSADSGDAEDGEDTRFVWDESALTSDVSEEAPGWLRELTESEDWPDTISESVIEEWTRKIDDDLIEVKDPKAFVTRPLGPTRELDGVPERLVSRALPEWLGDKSEEPAAPVPAEKITVEEAELADIEEEEELTDLAELADIEDREAFLDLADLADIEDEEAFLDLAEMSDVEDKDEVLDLPEQQDDEELTIEDTQEIAISGLPELRPEVEYQEIEEVKAVYVKDSAEIEMPSAEPELAEALVEQPVIPDDWLDDLAEAEDIIEYTALESFSSIDELLVEDRVAEDRDLSDQGADAQEIGERPTIEADSEVPTWLARLTNKLLDTFDNEFVNEWFSREKVEDKQAVESIQDEMEPTKSEAEQELDIDPFYGEIIPDWLRQTEAEAENGQSGDTLSETPADVSFEEQEIIQKDKDKYSALIAAGAVASSDEWLTLLEKKEDGEGPKADAEKAEVILEESPTQPEVPVETSPEAFEEELVELQYEMAEEEIEEELPGPIGIASTDEYLIPEKEAADSVDIFVMTREQRQQVALLKRLTSAEPRVVRPVRGQISATIAPNMRIIIGLLLLLLILAGWLIPTSLDPLEGFIQPSLVGSEREVYEAVQSAAGKPVLVAFEYTPAMAGELDSVAATLLQQMAENGSPVVAVTQVAAGTAMAHKMLEAVEDLESYDLGFLPGEAIGLRRLALCLTGEASCETIFGQPLDLEAVEALNNFALILILTSDRDAIVNWIEQVGPSVDQELIGGIIQPLQPIVAPYVNSDQLVGTIPGAQSALAYQQLLLEVDSINGIKPSALALAYWFTAAVLIVGSIYYAARGNSPRSEGKEAAK